MTGKDYFNRGLACFAKDQYDEAIEAFTKAIELNDGYAFSSYVNLGVVYFEKGEYDKATDACTKAIEIDPGFIGAYHNRGDFYCKQGKFALAIKDYKKVLELEKKLAETEEEKETAGMNEQIEQQGKETVQPKELEQQLQKNNAADSKKLSKSSDTEAKTQNAASKVK